MNNEFEIVSQGQGCAVVRKWTAKGYVYATSFHGSKALAEAHAYVAGEESRKQAVRAHDKATLAMMRNMTRRRQ